MRKKYIKKAIGRVVVLAIASSLISSCSDGDENNGDPDSGSDLVDGGQGPDGDTDTDTDGDTDTDTDADTDADTDTDGDTDTDADTDGDAGADGDSDTDGDAGTDTDSVPSCLFYVSQGANPSVGNGLSWGYAFSTLQQGLAAAAAAVEAYEPMDAGAIAMPRCEVWVADGYYLPSNEQDANDDREATFTLREHVDLYGGFAGGETLRSERDPEANQTVLSGDIGDPGHISDNSYHVVTGANSAVIDGFSITGGNADGNGELAFGGGMFIKDVSSTLSNCVFRENHAREGGGGLAVIDASSELNVTSCTFVDNRVAYAGGGMHIAASDVMLKGCVFDGNVSDGSMSGGVPIDDEGSGGAIMATAESHLEINDGRFMNNQTLVSGGAIFARQTDLVLQTSVFENNHAKSNYYVFGGGVYFGVTDGPYKMDVSGCTFRSNSAFRGGAIYSNGGVATINGSTFYGNLASDHNQSWGLGGAIESDNCFISGSSFVANVSKGRAGAVMIGQTQGTITNCVFAANHSMFEGNAIQSHTADIAVNSSTFVANRSAYIPGSTISVVSVPQDSPAGPRVTNSILWFNGEDESHPEQLVKESGDGTISVTYSNVHHWSGGGEGNIDTDPLFVDRQHSFFGRRHIEGLHGIHLDVDSPCINTGSGAALPANLLLDMDGNPRVLGDGVDMGADEAAFIYVDSDAAGGNDGTGWTDAFNSLQDALDQAQQGNWILMAAGTYIPTKPRDAADERTRTFALKEGVSIFGGFEFDSASGDTFATRDWVAHDTVLSGDIGVLEDPSDNAYHVVVGAGDATLDGVIITGGRADSAGADHDSRMGGGLFNDGCSPTVRSTVFADNFGFKGAAVYNRNASPRLYNSIFVRNSAGVGSGGAVASEQGAAPLIVNCSLAANHATIGGALYSNEHSLPEVINSILWGNGTNPVYGQARITYSDVEGGCAVDGGCTVEVDNNLNSAPEWEGWNSDYAKWSGNDWEVPWDAQQWTAALTDTSLCVDTGNYVAVAEWVSDFYGRDRFSQFNVDMGAVELPVVMPQSCQSYKDANSEAADGVYMLYRNGDARKPWQTYCDMTRDEGAWTLVINILGTSTAHAGNAEEFGDLSDHNQAAKLSDEEINTLTTQGKWLYECGDKDAHIANDEGTWSSMHSNALNWKIDQDLDGTFDCTANREYYVFSDHLGIPLLDASSSCSEADHTNFANSNAPGCFHHPSWGRDGKLWTR